MYIYIYISPPYFIGQPNPSTHIYIYTSLSLSPSRSYILHIYLCICICVCVNVHASMSVCGFVLFCFPALRSSWGLWFRLQAETCQAKHESEEWNKKTGSAALKCQDQTPVSTQRQTSKVQTKDFPSRIAGQTCGTCVTYVQIHIRLQCMWVCM